MFLSLQQNVSHLIQNTINFTIFTDLKFAVFLAIVI